MSTLPWDRFGPPPTEPEPELPYVPPPTTPILPPQPLPPSFPEQPPVSTQPSVPAAPDVDISDLAKELAKDLGKEILDYVKGTGQAVWHGQEVDITHPTVTATTAEGKELVVADAKNRSARTLIQGLIFDLFAAFIAVIATLAGADPFQKETWIAFGVLLLKSLISAGISYIMRINVTPTIKGPEGEKMAIMPLMEPLPTTTEGKHSA